jgi:hypothetical protein
MAPNVCANYAPPNTSCGAKLRFTFALPNNVNVVVGAVMCRLHGSANSESTYSTTENWIAGTSFTFA